MGEAVSAVRRLTAEKSGMVGASADDAWALLADWGGVLRWWPKNDAPRHRGLVINLSAQLSYAFRIDFVIDSTVDVDLLRGTVESVYESHILFGFNQYFSNRIKSR